MNKAIFLDRDGVLNVERGDYTYKPEDFLLEHQVPEALKMLKMAGYKLIVITNQAGISLQLYAINEMKTCHKKLDEATGGIIDAIYFSPYHPTVTESLSRKPGTLLFEKAIARFGITPEKSWMIGDRERDLTPAKQLGISTVRISTNPQEPTEADLIEENLYNFSLNLLRTV